MIALLSVAPLGELQERLGAGARQRDDVAGQLALLGFRLHRLAHERRQARELGLVVERKCEALLVGQNVLAERGAKACQPLGDRREPRLGSLVETGAGVAETGVITLENAPAFGIEAECVDAARQRIYSPVQAGIGVDLVPVPGHARRYFAFDLEQGVVGMGAGQEVERISDPRQQPAGALKGNNRVVEAWRSRICGDRRDLARVLGERPVIGLSEMLRLYVRERGDFVGGGPFR